MLAEVSCLCKIYDIVENRLDRNTKKTIMYPIIVMYGCFPVNKTCCLRHVNSIKLDQTVDMRNVHRHDKETVDISNDHQHGIRYTVFVIQCACVFLLFGEKNKPFCS